MTFIQALLIGLIAGLTVLDGNWLGEAKFREPVVTGFLVGLALGDVTKGLKVGAELQLLWMGATGIGPTAQLDIGTGGTIGAAVAIMTGKGAETAILFGVPVAVVMQFINTLLIASYSGLMHKVDNDIEAGNFKSIALTHHFCNWATFALYSLVAFIAMYFGHGVIQAIADGLPAWANAGLNGVAALLPVEHYLRKRFNTILNYWICSCRICRSSHHYGWYHIDRIRNRNDYLSNSLKPRNSCSKCFSFG